MTHNPDGVDTHQPDAFDDAMRDDPTYFAGQIVIDAHTVVSHKGWKRVPYDPEIHQGLRTAALVSFDIAPLDPTRRMISREIVDWDRSFKGIVRPSLEALGEKVASIKNLVGGQFNVLRAITGLFIIGEFVPKSDNKEGETYTTMKFIDVFATEAECKAAYTELIGEEPGEEQLSLEAQAERASLAAFLPGLWEQANHDAMEMAEVLAANEMLAKYFTMDSPEIKEMVDADPSSTIPI